VKPGRYNYRIVQGDTFKNTPVWKVNSVPINVTGYSALMQIRKAVGGTVLATLTSANDSIVVGTVDGSFTLYMSPATTSALQTGEWVYDLQVTAPGGTVTTLLQGGFVITAQVTA
jgi:hypothetical protein